MAGVQKTKVIPRPGQGCALPRPGYISVVKDVGQCQPQGETPSFPDAWGQVRDRNPSFKNASEDIRACLRFASERLNHFDFCHRGK